MATGLTLRLASGELVKRSADVLGGPVDMARAWGDFVGACIARLLRVCGYVFWGVCLLLRKPRQTQEAYGKYVAEIRYQGGVNYYQERIRTTKKFPT